MVKLCKGSAHRLNAPVVFTARGQTLTTEDNPLGLDRAMLVVEGERQSTAISYVLSVRPPDRALIDGQGRLQRMLRHYDPVVGDRR